MVTTHRLALVRLPLSPNHNFHSHRWLNHFVRTHSPIPMRLKHYYFHVALKRFHYLSRCCYRHRCHHDDLHHDPNDDLTTDNLNSTLMMRQPAVMVQRCPNFDDPAMWPTVESTFHVQYFPDPKCHDCCMLHTFLCRPQLLLMMTMRQTMSMLMLYSVFHYCYSVLGRPLLSYHKFYKQT